LVKIYSEPFLFLKKTSYQSKNYNRERPAAAVNLHLSALGLQFAELLFLNEYF
jgi:hypothetical protein